MDAKEFFANFFKTGGKKEDVDRLLEEARVDAEVLAFQRAGLLSDDPALLEAVRPLLATHGAALKLLLEARAPAIANIATPVTPPAGDPVLAESKATQKPYHEVALGQAPEPT